MKRKVCICLLFLLAGWLPVEGQTVVLKSNLLYDATTTANLGIEFSLGNKWTLDVSANFNNWDFADNKKWKQLSVQPEVRYWPCERFNGHFWGAHIVGGIYNFGNLDMNFKLFGTDFGQLKNNRYEGWMVGAGIAYGYHWILSRRWSLEGSLGLGYIYTRADKYLCPRCGEQFEDNKPHHYFGPTKIALNLVYAF